VMGDAMACASGPSLSNNELSSALKPGMTIEEES